MNVSEDDLRSNYESKDTERLLELRASGTLTETATRVLNQVLEARAVPSDVIAQSEIEVSERLVQEREALASLASFGERLGAQFIDFLFASVIAVLFFLLSMVIPVASFAGGILFWGYLLFSDGLPGGQSIGKRALGIAVLDQTPVSLARTADHS